jgi:hypothetical protein
LDSWVDSEDWSVLDLMLPALWELGMSLVSWLPESPGKASDGTGRTSGIVEAATTLSGLNFFFNTRIFSPLCKYKKSNALVCFCDKKYKQKKCTAQIKALRYVKKSFSSIFPHPHHD